MDNSRREIWVFGDHRNYFKNRITLQLLAKALALAKQTDAEVAAVVFGRDVDEYVREYIAHGAQRVYVVDHPDLEHYGVEKYTALMARIAEEHRPEILLVGATTFGKEFAPGTAKRLGTGLSADCIDLDIGEDGRLLQIAPAFGGNLIAKIVTPNHRPQMATVRPGVFQELPHDDDREGKVIPIPLPDDLPEERIRTIRRTPAPDRKQRIESADIVVCGGRGMGSKKKFKKIFDLARLLGGEAGATRPAVYARWADHDVLVGQAGKNIKPKILFSMGISGAIQHTAAITDADFIIAVNKNPGATMMKMADVAVVADANQICLSLIRELKKRIRS